LKKGGSVGGGKQEKRVAAGVAFEELALPVKTTGRFMVKHEETVGCMVQH